ncbi:MAG: hypothetical protein MJA29_13305, partial [Candidatus Omnitrophica bacterium]|nr:hypothetical protein [Candidatus Omnitrophota bacterium]
KTMILAVIVLIIVGVSFTIIFCCFRRCRFASSIFRTCFPWCPRNSGYYRGTPKTDIFVEIVELETGNTQWAHFATIGLSPTQIYRHGQLQQENITLVTVCRFYKQMRVDWRGVTLKDKWDREIKLNSVGMISIWTSGKLHSLKSSRTYDIKIMGRILDQIFIIQQASQPLTTNIPMATTSSKEILEVPPSYTMRASYTPRTEEAIIHDVPTDW